MAANVAVIAGSSQGIGLNLAKLYLSRTSLQVYALSRRPDEAKQAILDGISDDGTRSRLKTLHVDANAEDSVAEAARSIKSDHGESCLRLLFNVAGVLHAEKGITQVDEQKALEVFR